MYKGDPGIGGYGYKGDPRLRAGYDCGVLSESGSGEAACFRERHPIMIGIVAPLLVIVLAALAIVAVAVVPQEITEPLRLWLVSHLP